jgi:hypothetical protein
MLASILKAFVPNQKLAAARTAMHLGRYGVAVVSVALALGAALLLRGYGLPHPFLSFSFAAVAITFWYKGSRLSRRQGTREVSVKEGPSGRGAILNLAGSQTWAGRRSAEPNGQKKRRLSAGGNAHYAEISGTLKAPMPRRITAEEADIESDFGWNL